MIEYLQFIRGLDNQTFSSIVKEDKLPLMAPFDVLVADALSLKNATPEQINKIAKLHLHADDYTKLVGLETDTELALMSYKKLVNDSVGEEILRKLDAVGLFDALDMEETLVNIEELLKARHVAIPEQRAKLWGDLNERDDDRMFRFLKYNISRGKISLMAAFSGIGKTISSLCFAQQATSEGYTVLLIALKDWSEAELKRKAQSMPHKDNIAFAVYGDCSLSDIDYEINIVKPDVVIVDALTDITMPYSDKLHRTIGEAAGELRAMAVEYDCHMFTTHQTNTLEPLVLPSHLRDSKSNLLQPLDIAWGLGSSSVSNTQRIINTVKVKHQESVRPWKCAFDYNALEIHDKGMYEERAAMFNR